MKEEKAIMFRNRLVKVFRHLKKQAKRLGVSCFRVYDHDLPEFPFCIEVYDNNLYVAEYKRRHAMTDEEHEVWMEECKQVMSETLGIDEKDIFIKLRQRKPGRGGQYQKENEERKEFIVEEQGLKFIVNLSDYLDTGLFLDHRVTRNIVREEAKGKKVLNLFCYTGSFSVYAAAGGADEVDSVDLSKTYLDWGKRNIELNGFINEQRYKFIHADVLQYLKALPADHYDLVVMDPPTFSNSKRMEDILDIQRDHVVLINDCLQAMKKDATLFFSTNYSKFILEKNKIQSSLVTDITKSTTPFDFEGKLQRYCFRIVK